MNTADVYAAMLTAQEGDTSPRTPDLRAERPAAPEKRRKPRRAARVDTPALHRGRSALRLLGAPAPHRTRPWGRRYAVTGVIALVIGAVIWLCVTEIAPTSGPARVIYQLHDSLWLPLRAALWTRPGFIALVGWLPVAVLSVLALIEFLGIASPLRRLQVAALSWFLQSRLAMPILGLQSRLGWSRNYERLLVAVAHRQMTEAETALKAHLAARLPLADRAATKAAQRVAQSAANLAYLRGGESATRIRCLEALHLCRAMPAQDTARALESQLTTILGEAAFAPLLAACTPDPISAATAYEHLVQGRITPEEAALTTLALAARTPNSVSNSAPNSIPDGTPVLPALAQAWLTEWARPVAARKDILTAAEGLIDTAFWAGRIDQALDHAPSLTARQTWLHDLLPATPLRRELGEAASAGMTRLHP